MDNFANYMYTLGKNRLGKQTLGNFTNGNHLCFKQAQPKMCHSRKVDDGVEIFFKNSFKTFFWIFLKEL